MQMIGRLVFNMNEKRIGKHALKAMTNMKFQFSDLDYVMNHYKNIILLDNLTDQRNIGSIIRTAAICEFAVLLREKSSINEFTLKCSSGGTEYTDICNVRNIQETLNRLKQNGFWVIGLSEKGSREVPVGFDKKVLVIGSEGDGISTLVKNNCDLLWRLNGSSNFDVYNASNAAAIGMYMMFNE
jgi:23S rRNA (guanosine2251-2'-O)-methyltransferase